MYTVIYSIILYYSSDYWSYKEEATDSLIVKLVS